MKACRNRNSELLHIGARARMHRKDQRQPLRDLPQRTDDARECLLVVHVRGAVQGHHAIFFELLLERIRREHARVHLLELLELVEEVVDHHVPDEVDALLGMSLAAQVLHAARLGAEEVVADGVGDDAVDLLRHGHVATSQARLDVGDGDAELLGHDRAGERGVHVAHHHDEVGPVLHAHPLEGHHDARSLLRVRAAANAQVVVRLRDAELLKEDLAHAVVVVLAGVDELGLELVLVLGQFTHDGGDLHEVGACAGD